MSQLIILNLEIYWETQKEIKLNMFFYSSNTKEVCRLETIIIAQKNKSEGIRYSIGSESHCGQNLRMRLLPVRQCWILKEENR